MSNITPPSLWMDDAQKALRNRHFQEILSILRSDAHAASFQSMAQYRAALIRAIEGRLASTSD